VCWAQSCVDRTFLDSLFSQQINLFGAFCALIYFLKRNKRNKTTKKSNKEETKQSSTQERMTRFSAVAGIVAAAAWLVTSTPGCKAGLVEGRSSHTALWMTTPAEHQQQQQQQEADRMNLRSSTSWISSSVATVPNNSKEEDRGNDLAVAVETAGRVTPSRMLPETHTVVKSLAGSAMTKDGTAAAHWARRQQLKRDGDQIFLTAQKGKDAATIHRFLYPRASPRMKTLKRRTVTYQVIAIS
jgi:hypothetical protein